MFGRIKYILAFLLFCSSLYLAGYAQPTINAADFPQIGDSIRTIRCKTNNISAGASGGGAFWDFSSAQAATDGGAVKDTLIYADPMATPYGEIYITPPLAPTVCGWSATPSGAYYAYFQVNGDSAVVLGSSIDETTAQDPKILHFVYDDPQKVVKFPFTYTNTFDDDYSMTSENSFEVGGMPIDQKVYTLGKDKVTGDGFGKIKTPQGVFPNVLRMKTETHRSSYTTISVNGSGVDQQRDSVSSVTYNWYYKPKRAMIATLSYTTSFQFDSSGAISSTSLDTSFSYNPITPGDTSTIVYSISFPQHTYNITCGDTIDVSATYTDVTGATFFWYPNDNIASPNSPHTLMWPHQTMTYSLYMNVGNDSKYDTLRVNVLPFMTATAEVDGHTATAVHASTPNIQYQWSHRDANGSPFWSDMAGATTKSINVTQFSPVYDNGFYKARITNTLNGCWVETNEVQILIESRDKTSIADRPRVYPNPAREVINVSTPKNQTGRVTLIDAVGRTVKNTAIEGALSLPVNDLPAGVYTLRVQTPSGTFNERIVLQ